MKPVLSRNALAWLLVAQAVAVVPLFFVLPKWLPGLWVVMVFWRVQIYRGAWPFPSRVFKYVLSFSCIAGLIFSYSNPLALEPAVAFLAVSFVLKLAELHERRDGFIIINIGFVAIAASFLFFQSVFITIFSTIAVCVHLAAWSCFYRLRSVHWFKQLSQATIMVAQAFPVMVILFLVLPRLGSFWHVPLPEGSGTTGFGDTMSPGDLSNLIRSNKVAFRVSFDQASQNNEVVKPSQNDLYWRGLVLDYFDGRKWIRTTDIARNDSHRGYGKTAFANVPQRQNLESNRIKYEVILEPHGQSWLFGLSVPQLVSSRTLNMNVTKDALIRSHRKVTSRSQYIVNSSLYGDTYPADLSYVERIQYLQLPKEGNDKARQMAEKWKEQVHSDEAFIQRALAFFNSSFTYTLQPPLLGKAPVDEFLFDTQRGFCEHFSSSFVFLLRAAGIPARVVVGYQGGEFNTRDEYLIVRQSDAHAWVEVWSEPDGWRRVDPTAAVAPSRIELGLREALSTEDSGVLSGLFGLDSQSFLLLKTLRLRIDGIGYAWDRWIFGYDSQAQKAFLRKWFGSSAPWLIVIVFACVGGVFLFFYIFVTQLTRRKSYASSVEKYYAKHLNQLEKYGYIKQPGETPARFARRIAKLKPAWSKGLYRIAVLHDSVMYAGRNSRITHFIKAVRRFPNV